MTFCKKFLHSYLHFIERTFAFVDQILIQVEVKMLLKNSKKLQIYLPMENSKNKYLFNQVTCFSNNSFVYPSSFWCVEYVCICRFLLWCFFFSLAFCISYDDDARWNKKEANTNRKGTKMMNCRKVHKLSYWTIFFTLFVIAFSSMPWFMVSILKKI